MNFRTWVESDELESFYRDNEPKALADPEVQRQLKTLFQADGQTLRSLVGTGPHDERGEINYFVRMFNMRHGDLDRRVRLTRVVRPQYKGEFAYRYVHKDGTGLLNNLSLDYERIQKDQHYNDIQQGLISMEQPGWEVSWNNPDRRKDIIFVFTPEGEKKHRRLINLTSKISRTGVVRQKLRLADYEIVWESDDGQLGLVPKLK